MLASIGTVGDAYDNSMAESSVDTFKTELIKDRVWQTNSQLELQVLEYAAWFNARRLHTSIGNRPPLEVETEYHATADAHRLFRSKVTSSKAHRSPDTVKNGSTNPEESLLETY